ncbi:MAG TPA: hypothetical protein VII00_04595 [bacterium]
MRRLIIYMLLIATVLENRIASSSVNDTVSFLTVPSASILYGGEFLFLSSLGYLSSDETSKFKFSTLSLRTGIMRRADIGIKIEEYSLVSSEINIDVNSNVLLMRQGLYNPGLSFLFSAGQHFSQDDLRICGVIEKIIANFSITVFLGYVLDKEPLGKGTWWGAAFQYAFTNAMSLYSEAAFSPEVSSSDIGFSALVNDEVKLFIAFRHENNFDISGNTGMIGIRVSNYSLTKRDIDSDGILDYQDPHPYTGDIHEKEKIKEKPKFKDPVPKFRLKDI